jgi:hypothetical protein
MWYNGKSQISQHLLENKNSIEPAKEIMSLVSIINKGRHINTMGRFYIYIYIQGVPGGMCDTSGECSLGQTISI